MPVIQVLIFRGTGGVLNKNHPYYEEPGLVRAGHVGVAGVIEGKIIGFHPTESAAEQLGSEEALIEALVRHEPQPGRLQDDTAYFERAYELIEDTGGRTTVFIYDAEISEEMLDTIRVWYHEGNEEQYNFPDDEGNFVPGEYNCAIFWTRFGVELPVKTGSLRELTSKMQAEEYDVWRPKDTS